MGTWRKMLLTFLGVFLLSLIVGLTVWAVTLIPYPEESEEISIVSAGIGASQKVEISAPKTWEELKKEWEEKREEERIEREKRLEISLEKQRIAFLEAKAKLNAQHKNSKNRQVRRVRRFKWESPAKMRGRVWNVPREESEQSVLNAFLRVCIAESDGHLQDCVGIWQVVHNIRLRNCNRGYVRKITECDENGETTLSAFRRAQKHVLQMIRPRNARVRWISQIDTDCEPPKNWPHSEAVWDSRYAKKCQHIVELGKHLIKGELPPSRPGARLKWIPGRPIAWGGRCESGRASCDDRMACAQNYARIPVDTENAFWCRVGASGCRTDPEPICIALGYDYDKIKRKVPKKILEKRGETGASDEENGHDHPGGEEVSSESSGGDVGEPRDDIRGQEEHLGEEISS